MATPWWLAKGGMTAGLVLLMAGGHASGETVARFYSGLRPADCHPATPAVTAFYAAPSRGLAVVECPLPRPLKRTAWHLFVVSSAERSWLDVARHGTVWSTQNEVVYEQENQSGHFPNIGKAPAEWHVDQQGMPVALTVRVTAQDPARLFSAEGTTSLSRLLVFGFRAQGVCFVGLARDNPLAARFARPQSPCRRWLPAERLP